MTKKPFGSFFNKLKNIFSKKKNEDINDFDDLPQDPANETQTQDDQPEIPIQKNALSSAELDDLKKLREQLAQVTIDDEEWESKDEPSKTVKTSPMTMSKPSSLVIPPTAIKKEGITAKHKNLLHPSFEKSLTDFSESPKNLESTSEEIDEVLSSTRIQAKQSLHNSEEDEEENIPIQEIPIQRGSIAQLDKNNVDGTKESKRKKISSLISQVFELFRKLRGGRGIEFEQFFHHIYSPEFRPQLHRLFILLLIGIMTYSLGKSIALWIRPEKKIILVRRSFTSAPSSSTADQIQKVTQSNLFNIKQNESDEKKIENIVSKVETPKVCLTAERQSTLPYKIVNTSVLQDTVKSIASIQVRDNEVVNIREGETFETMELGRILRQKIIIKNVQTNECEYLENMDQSNDRKFDILSPANGKKLINSKFITDIKNEGNRFSIKKKLRDEMVSDISNVLSQAKAIPIQNPDGTIYFKMTEIVPGSIYSKLNILDEDIITNIDGEKIKNFNEVMNKFGKIKDIDHIEITVQRNGNEQRLEYSFD